MIYKLPLQLFRFLPGFRNKSTYFDQTQRSTNRDLCQQGSIPPSWICIRYAYVTSRVKSEIFILQTTCHYQYETRFSEVFLVLN
jgi:hypothetical protein